MIKMFKNKTVLITGAAVGIWRACAIQFAQNNANVILVDNNPETLQKTEKEIKTITDNVLSFLCDVTDNTSVLNVTRKAVNSFGKIDILINNAAIWRCFTAFNETDIDVWKKLIDVNIMGTVYFTKAVIDQMIANNYGRIIFVTKRLFLSFSLIGVNIRQF
jgi:NADP-dependent 3-hydroxy acid dehydrogenase YdfG